MATADESNLVEETLAPLLTLAQALALALTTTLTTTLTLTADESNLVEERGGTA